MKAKPGQEAIVARPGLSRGQWWALFVPYLWLLIFFLAPFVIVVKISLSQSALSQPPYIPIFDLSKGVGDLIEKAKLFSLDSYRGLFEDSLYVESYLSSLRLAFVATLLTLAVAYPLAYAMARAPARIKPVLVMIAIAPFWTSFLIRVYAWIMILKDEGLLNQALMTLGIIREPLAIFATDKAVVIGIVYSYLPFMVLPLFNAIDKQDPSLIEAAADLGARPAQAFWHVTFPLSLPGILAGSLLVFIPAIGEFVIPDLLGGSDTLMIGRTMWDEFFENRDWPTASAAAIVLLALLVVPLWLYERAQISTAEK
ncbi:MAG TPA: ABC transporter permease subunit [Beijerinckiaceae bacterium]|nr:ABC transporter permease subunit [Beijerinckiaceae bacterium]